MDVKERLAAERQRLLGVLDGLTVSGVPEGGEGSERDQYDELSTVDQHPADAGTEVFDREEVLSVRQSVEAELDDIDRALAKVDDGTYGKCEICGKDIGAERLEAFPAARLCVEDQARVEAEGASPRLSAGDVPLG
ncbi:MAG TPA: TraR/DksA C4-type zinc finger protein [Acidimicrobiales bacterium]|jgi:RNA polymerase-binding transcription factor DksA|nr:TraR/DksA C4-type zinc finger protein [Acidimicrobiales bacterium]